MDKGPLFSLLWNTHHSIMYIAVQAEISLTRCLEICFNDGKDCTKKELEILEKVLAKGAVSPHRRRQGEGCERCRVELPSNSSILRRFCSTCRVEMRREQEKIKSAERRRKKRESA